MNQSQSQSQRPPSVTTGRRGVLGGGVACIGLLFAGPVAQAAPAGGALEVTPVGGTSWVATGPSAHVEVPEVLGARVRVRSGRVDAGSVVTVSWDHRVYDWTRPSLWGDDGSPVGVRLIGTPVRDDTGSTRARVRVTGPLVAGRSYVLALGARRSLRFPDDVVTDPLPLGVVIGDGRDSGARRTMPPTDRSSVALWGATVGVGWRPVRWGAGFHSWVPELVTVRAVGPGAVPAGSVVEVRLDARLVDAIAAESSDGSVLARSQRIGGGLVGLRWQLARDLSAQQRVTARITSSSARPSGPLNGLQAPMVSCHAAGRSTGQRITGSESASRQDSAADPASAVLYGLDLAGAGRG